MISIITAIAVSLAACRMIRRLRAFRLLVGGMRLRFRLLRAGASCACGGT